MHKLLRGVVGLVSFVILGLLVIQHSKQPSISVSYFELDSKARQEVDCLADNIYFEARGESVQGQKAVASVTINRTQSDMFPKTICGVVKEKLNQVCQFSWWCNNTIRATVKHAEFRATELYQDIRMIALDAYLNHSTDSDPTEGALFYHANYVSKSLLGISNLKRTVQIGQHIFYRI